MIKSAKECTYVIMWKIALVLVKIHVLVGEKGTSELVSQVAAKPTANLVYPVVPQTQKLQTSGLIP